MQSKDRRELVAYVWDVIEAGGGIARLDCHALEYLGDDLACRPNKKVDVLAYDSWLRTMKERVWHLWITLFERIARDYENGSLTVASDVSPRVSRDIYTSLQTSPACVSAMDLPYLPLEMWDKILRYLTRDRMPFNAQMSTLACVCRDWRSLVLSHIRTVRLSERTRSSIVTSSSCVELVRFLKFLRFQCPYIRRIDLRHPRSFICKSAAGQSPCRILHVKVIILTEDALSLLPDTLESFAVDCDLIVGSGDNVLAALPSSLQGLVLRCCRGMAAQQSASVLAEHGPVHLNFAPITARNIQVLDLWGSAGVTNESLKHLPKSLKCLGLAWTAMNDTGLQYLEQLHNLVALDLTGCKITKSNMLAHLPSSLQRLSLAVNERLSSLSGLEHLTQLQFLDLTGCQRLTDSGLTPLDKLSRLEMLDLTLCPEVTGRCLHHIPCESLRELHIGELEFYDWPAAAPAGGSAVLTRFTRLETLTLPMGTQDLDLTGLPASLRKLSLDSFSVTDEGLLMLPAGITALHLRPGPDITDGGLVAGIPPKLELLLLEENDFDLPEMGTEPPTQLTHISAGVSRATAAMLAATLSAEVRVVDAMLDGRPPFRCCGVLTCIESWCHNHLK